MEPTFISQVIGKVGENIHLLLIFVFGIKISFGLRRANTWAYRLSLIAFILLILNLFFGAVRNVQHESIAKLAVTNENFYQLFRYSLVSGAYFFSQLFGWLLLVLALHNLKEKAAQPSA